MATFHYIKWVNFLSTGSAGNELYLDVSRTTLITGLNGSGKSTGVTDAICFALFNKPFRKINRGQLVNSVNGKKCLVTVKFSNNGNEYVVNRGIRPDVFEIYENGVLFNKESSTRDYQKILEEQILRYNFKTFTQVVLLGSSSFIPFMQLPKASRREVIEDVLDIGVFSSMNELLKKEYQITKDSISSNNSDLSILQEKINSQKKIIALIKETNESAVKELEDKIIEFNERNSLLVDSVAAINEQIKKIDKKTESFDEYISDRDKAKRLLVKVESALEKIETELSFFRDNESCPTCSQCITDNHKETIESELNTKKTEQLDKKEILDSALSKLNKQIDKLNKLITESDALRNEVRKVEYEINYNKNEIEKLQKSIKEKQQKTNIVDERNKLKQFGYEGIELTETNEKLINKKTLQEQALLLLKDNGIKTSIIREYLPVINRQINKYLSSMEFFCNFEIDEEFNEVIKSRYRDDFSYSSFSQGQKQRIDIAIMFTFREIAKMKNSLSTNLLVLDEIFSSSLDEIAVNFLIELLNSLNGTNTFVVTHSAINEFAEAFDSHFHFKEVNNFSIMQDLTNG